MSGTGFTVKIKRLPDGEGTAEELYYALHALVQSNVRRFAKGKAYKQVTDDYLGMATDDGAGRDTELDLGFRDGGGLCSMSMEACYHWYLLLVSALAESRDGAPSSLDVLANAHGFTIAERPEPLATLLESCEAPLVEVRRRLFGTGTSEGSPYLIGDETDDDRIEYEDLDDEERASVAAALEAKRCECRVCMALRDPASKLLRPKVKKKPSPKKAPSLGVETTLDAARNHRTVYDPACTALPDGVFAPPTLQELVINAPVSAIPDAIANLGELCTLHLVNTKLTRLPAVLARIPSLHTLRVYGGHLETPADLGMLPSLTSLSIESLPSLGPRMEELPFDAFAESLERLELTNLGLATLPAGIGSLRALRTLNLWSNPFTTLPPSFENLQQLHRLAACATRLVELPTWFGKLAALRELSIDSEAFTTFAPGSLPPGLTELEIEAPALAAIPEAIGELRDLTRLRFINTAIAHVPEGIRNLVFLRNLWFFGETALPALPPWLGELTALEELWVKPVPSTGLPESMRALSRLKELTLESSPITELPEWFGDLASLEVLSLRRLALTALPDSFRKLTKLRRLDLRGTRISTLPDWIAELPLEYVHFSEGVVSKAEGARLRKILPKGSLTIDA